MKYLSIIIFSFSLMFAQTVVCDTTVVDTVSSEELFLQDISDRALLKDEKRKEFKMDMLTVAVVYLLIDKFFINKEGK